MARIQLVPFPALPSLHHHQPCCSRLLKSIRAQERHGAKGYTASHHVAGAGEVVVEQAFQGHPADGPVLIVPQAVVIHGKQVPRESVVRNLHLHVVVNAAADTRREKPLLVSDSFPKRIRGRPREDTYTQFLAARSLCMTSLRAR